jgi:hypothetical protein
MSALLSATRYAAEVSAVDLAAKSAALLRKEIREMFVV